MPTLHAPGKLALILIATVAGCYEGGALDPLSPATATPPATSYRELSLLANTFNNQVGSCTVGMANPARTITPSSALNNCIFTISGFTVPAHTGEVRIHSGISSSDTLSTLAIFFTLSFNSQTASPLFSVNLSSQTKAISDFSVTVPSAQPIDSNTKIYVSFDFGSSKMPLTLNRLGIELDVPSPGSI